MLWVHTSGVTCFVVCLLCVSDEWLPKKSGPSLWTCLQRLASPIMRHWLLWSRKWVSDPEALPWHMHSTILLYQIARADAFQDFSCHDSMNNKDGDIWRDIYDIVVGYFGMHSVHSPHVDHVRWRWPLIVNIAASFPLEAGQCPYELQTSLGVRLEGWHPQ